MKKNLYDLLGQKLDIPRNITNTISNFEYQEKKQTISSVYKKVAVAFSFIIISVNLAVYAFKIGEIFKAENSIGYVNNSLQQAVENGYIQNVEMDYLYSNKMGAKIDYIIMSDNNLNILFNFDISNKNIKENMLAYIQDLLIYDENDNIIYCYDYETYKDFCKKKNIEYNEYKIEHCGDTFGNQKIETSSLINKTLYTFNTTKGFPKSRKLYIQFNSVYFDRAKNNKVKGRWNLELNLNEQFYNREEIKYELETQNDDIELISANVTETMMRIRYKIKDLENIKPSSISMYLEDDNGNRYDMNKIEDSIFLYKEEISGEFPIDIRENFEYLILHISIDKQEYIPVVLELKE